MKKILPLEIFNYLLEQMERFHEYGRDIEFSEGRRVAHRPPGIDPIAVVFSERPLKVGELFAVQIESAGNTEWHTRGIVGLTQVNPNASPKLPSAVYNDLHYCISSNTLAGNICNGYLGCDSVVRPRAI